MLQAHAAAKGETPAAPQAFRPNLSSGITDPNRASRHLSIALVATQIHMLPVLDAGKLVGVISPAEILRQACQLFIAAPLDRLSR